MFRFHRSLFLIASLFLFGFLFCMSASKVEARSANTSPYQTGNPPTQYVVITDTALLTDSEPVAPEAATDAAPVVLNVSKLPVVNAGTNAGDTAGAHSVAQITAISGITVDISLQDTVQAGDVMTYEFRYLNNSGGSVVNATLDAQWTNFLGNSAWQTCVTTGCQPESVIGPSIVLGTAPNGVGARYLLGDLPNGQYGSFIVPMRVVSTTYPQTGASISQPAGSVNLYVNDDFATAAAEDTANTTIVGPVLVLTKTASIPANASLYTGQVGEFVVRLGNATGSGDVVNGGTRADARTGTNVVVIDTFPKGSDIVSATGTYTYSSAAGLLTWTLPSLNPAQSVDYRVAFRKIDVEQDCKKLENLTIKTTSDEYPTDIRGVPYTVKSNKATITVIPPLQVTKIAAVPSEVYFGSQGDMTITVSSYYTAAITGLTLSYLLPGDLSYVTGTAVPAAVVSGTMPRGELLWTFDIPAGSKTTPATKTFYLKVEAAYIATPSIDGQARIINSGSISLPIACSNSVEWDNGPLDHGGPSVNERLTIDKVVGADIQPSEGSIYYVQRNEAFPYLITVTNRSDITATDVVITDVFPGLSAQEPGANFRYVDGTALLNSVPVTPTELVNGYRGRMVFRNLTLAPHSVITLRYQLYVDGYDYYTYCNSASTGSPLEVMDRSTNNEVCAKISPQVELDKQSITDVAGPGETVTFTLQLTNREAVSYTLGIYDALGDFTFVQQLSGYSQPVAVVGRNDYQWPLVTVAPGGVLMATIVARMPDTCSRGSYDNEMMFRVQSQGVVPAVYVVRQIPNMKATVICRSLQYSKISDREIIGLKDSIGFDLSVKNTHVSQPATNVTVVDVLPPNFTFATMSVGSAVSTDPISQVLQNGQVMLTWNMPFIAPSSTSKIKYTARSGMVVGSVENWMRASVPGYIGQCRAPCRAATENSVPVSYTLAAFSVQPLTTIAPVITETACALPNDTRTYRLSLINANNRSYNNIELQVRLPVGIRYSRAISGTTSPQVTVDNDGIQTIKWVGISVAAKPTNIYAAQNDYWIELKVGQVLGSLSLVAQASSPDTLIPRKDGVLDPIIDMCPITGVGIAKNVSHSSVTSGNEVVYQIDVVNPSLSPLTVNVEDALPANFAYVSSVLGGTPTVSGQKLSWLNVAVPAASSAYGQASMIFRVRTSGLEITKTNVASITYSSNPISTGVSSIGTYIVAPSATLTGVMFVDTNMNGVMDIGESTVAGLPITLTMSTGQVVATTADGNGMYAFNHVATGAYALSTYVYPPSPAVVYSYTTGSASSGNLAIAESKVQNIGYATLPVVSMNTASVNESGNASVLIGLSRPVSVPVRVGYSMAATGTAQANVDLNLASGVIEIPANSSAVSLPVSLINDSLYELNEVFYINLSQPENAVIGSAQGAVTIISDDAQPTLSVGSVSQDEGDSGNTAMRFVASLSAASSLTTSFVVSTGLGTAGLNDFELLTTTLTIPAGATQTPFTINITGDTQHEPDETFYIYVLYVVNSKLGSGDVIGTIVNDDVELPPSDRKIYMPNLFH